MEKINLIIPCFNEENNIGNLLHEIENLHNSRFHSIIINDCSTDHTSFIARKDINTEVIDLPINLGVGGAVQTGFILTQKEDAEFAIKLDGDGQHNPEYIEKLIKPLTENQADIVIGSRFLEKNSGYKSTMLRRLGIKILQITCKILTGLTITDPTSGFRAYNKKSIDFMAENYPNFDYPEPEEIILASKNKLRILEIPIIMRPRMFGESNITNLGSLYYMIKVILTMIFIKLR